MKKKSPGNFGQHQSKKHTATLKRWVERKKEETNDRLLSHLDTVSTLGGRKRTARRFAALRHIRAAKAREERQILATTSLKDLMATKPV